MSAMHTRIAKGLQCRVECVLADRARLAAPGEQEAAMAGDLVQLSQQGDGLTR